MKKSSKIVGGFLIILIASILIGKVYALSFKFKVTANKTEAKAGDEIIVSMEISDIDMGELGINAIESVLDYDDKIFETVTREDITVQNNWTMTYNQEAGAHSGNFLVSNIIAGVKQEQKIGEIKFKVRDDVKQGTTTEIKFKNVTSNDGQNLVKESDKKVTIKIIGETNNNIVAPIENTNNTPQVPNITINTTPVNNVKKNDLPYTGTADFIKVAIALVAVTSIIGYIKYKQIKIK